MKLRVVAASDEVAEVDGDRSVADWLAARSRRDRPECARTQRLATALAERPVLAAGLAEGRVNVSQAQAVVRALDQLGPSVRPELVARAEQVLVDHCAEFAPRELKRLGDRVLELLDPEVFDDQERQRLEAELAKAQAETRLSIHGRGDGTVDVTARLPVAAGVRLKTYLEAFTSPRAEQSGQSEHSGQPGQSGQSGQSRRGLADVATGRKIPHERLMGEAFCSLLESIDPAGLPLHGGTPTQLVVTIDLDRLTTGLGVGTLADGTPITAGQARRLACNAGIVPAVLGGRSEVLDLGRSRRLFTGAQRRALALRHRVCRAEGCTVPATWCEAHHANQPWSRGGRTDLADGQLLCSWHHHRAHDETYLVKQLPNGDVRFHKRT